MKLTQRELKRELLYNPETGLFTRKRIRSGVSLKNIIAGTIIKDGYIGISIKSTRFRAHRLAFLYMEGYLPENNIDYINKVRTDNRWCNLREVSHSCNAKNCNISKGNTSGITGIHFCKRTKKWVSQITHNRKGIYLGRYETLIDAAKVRYAAEVELKFPDCDINSSAKKFLDSL